MSDRVQVKSEKGLYDRTYEHSVYDINSRRMCLLKSSHEMVDSALHVRGPFIRPPESNRYYGGDLCEHDWQNPDRMSVVRQDGFYFCKRCKLIECVHYMTHTTYEIKYSPYHSRILVIGKCGRCDVRLLTGGGNESRPSSDACKIINEVASEMGVDLSRAGSGFHCEFPVQVSHVLEKSEQDARDYVRQTLRRGQVDLVYGSPAP